jgi:hypothetical protein
MQATRTIPNNKLDIITSDNEKGTCMLTDVAISRDGNLIKKEAEKIVKYKDPTTEIQLHVECKNKSDTTNNRGNWNHLKIIQKIPEQHNGKLQNQGATENSHVEHCTYTLERTNVKVQSIQHGK